MTEIADGIHRIESDLGPRFMCQYVVAGRDRSILADTGLAETPAAVIDPYLSRVGLEPDFVLISHADNDHVGGNRVFRDAHPEAVFACHELDRSWVESNETLVRENYGWHATYGFPAMPADELLASMSGDAPIDLGLAGGETIRLDANRMVEVLHLPGHTRGHLGLWDERTRATIVIDAVLADGNEHTGNGPEDRLPAAEALRSVQGRVPGEDPAAHWPRPPGADNLVVQLPDARPVTAGRLGGVSES